jgi:hypothetical protein
LVLSVVVTTQYTHSANRRRTRRAKDDHLGAGIFATDARVEELGTDSA